VNGNDLRPRLLDQRLNLLLLLGRQVQGLGQMSHRESLTLPAAVAAGESAMALGKSVTAKRDRGDGSECK